MKKISKKEVALLRMKKLNLMNDVIEQFKKDDVVFYSEYMDKNFNAVLYYVSNDSVLENKIKEFENEYKALVYHVQLTHSQFGDMYSFLYVSNHPEEWEDDLNDLEEDSCLVYVWNRTADDCSEFGSIGIKPSMGGVVRTW